MTLIQLLDKYHLARNNRDTKSQLEIADKLVEEEIPTLLSEFMTYKYTLAQQAAEAAEAARLARPGPIGE